jgi:HlyD family secretion protein
VPKKVIAIALIAVVILGVGAYQYVEQSRQLPEGLIQANGRIEGDAIIIASKQPGRITAVHVHDGDAVDAAQVLVELDDRAARARVAEAEAAQREAHAQADQYRAEYEVLSAEIPYSIDAATAAVAAGEALLQQAEAEEAQAQRDRQRYWALAESGSVGWETAEHADLRWSVARDQVAAVRAALTQARESLKDAELGPARITAKQAQVAAFEAAAAAAAARLDEAQSVWADLTIASPAPGAVTMRLADLGEVVNAGTPLLELVDLDRLYLKVYIPEVEIGKVRIGLPAHVYIDALPDTPFPAEVRNIASRAEFTPKEIQTVDERVNLVYAVKLYFLDNPDHRLTPGLPADAVIRWQEDASWAKPRW